MMCVEQIAQSSQEAGSAAGGTGQSQRHGSRPGSPHDQGEPGSVTALPNSTTLDPGRRQRNPRNRPQYLGRPVCNPETAIAVGKFSSKEKTARRRSKEDCGRNFPRVDSGRKTPRKFGRRQQGLEACSSGRGKSNRRKTRSRSLRPRAQRRQRPCKEHPVRRSGEFFPVDLLFHLPF